MNFFMTCDNAEETYRFKKITEGLLRFSVVEKQNIHSMKILINVHEITEDKSFLSQTREIFNVHKDGALGCSHIKMALNPLSTELLKFHLNCFGQNRNVEELTLVLLHTEQSIIISKLLSVTNNTTIKLKACKSEEQCVYCYQTGHSLKTCPTKANKNVEKCETVNQSYISTP